MQADLDSLLDYVRSEGRICPMPAQWNILWEMLPYRKRVGMGWEPALPLILSAWDTPPSAKARRLEEHIRYAASHGVLDEVDQYLRSLTPQYWYCG